MKKILITGASGFIGGFLVEKALQLGMNVHAAVRKSSNTKWLQDERIKFVYINYDDPLNLKALLKKECYDFIVHCAGLTKSADKEKYYQVNDQYLQVLVNQIIASNCIPDKLVFMSSLAAYGPAEAQTDGILNHKSIPRPLTTYGKSKLAAEQYLQTIQTVPWIILRPSAVYGPREEDLLTVFKILNKGLELHTGTNENQLTFIYVKDLVNIVFASLASKKNKAAYHVTDGLTYTEEHFNNCIKKILNKKTTVVKLPIKFIKVLAFLTEQLSRFTGKYPALNQEKVAELNACSWRCDMKPLEDDLAYSCQYSLEKGLAETIGWYKEQNIL